MKALFWTAAAIMAAFAALIGLYVHSWIEDPFPLNVLLAGHHITALIALCAGLALSGLAAWRVSRAAWRC